jgi:hypothetical protein
VDEEEIKELEGRGEGRGSEREGREEKEKR